MKYLILQPARGKWFLRTHDTCTNSQVDQADFAEITLASQRDRGISDDVVGQPYESAAEALATASKLKPKVRVITARMLTVIVADKEEAES